MTDEYTTDARSFAQPLRDQCRCSVFFIVRWGSTSAFPAWWANTRR